jgi:hypothetical protein
MLPIFDLVLYIEPGAASGLLAILSGGFAGLLLTLKLFGGKLRSFFSGDSTKLPANTEKEGRED